MSAPASASRRGEPIHQVLCPSANSGYAAETVYVVIHASRIRPDVNVAAGARCRAGTVCPQDRADLLELCPGFRGVSKDWADNLAGHGAVAFDNPLSRLAM
jgi:hypothetical protein